MKEKLYRFMYGRYGSDKLNGFLLVVGMILALCNVFIGQRFIFYVIDILWIIVIYRMFSRQYEKRRKENYKFLEMTVPFRRQKNLWKYRLNDKANRYYLCPSCHQMVRVPKGHGKVDITCPKCHSVFEKRT